MHGIEDITKEWDRSLIFTTPSGSNAIVYEFDLAEPVPLTESKLVLVAKGVTEGLAKAKYAFDSYGVLAEGHRVQVVLRLAESTLAGSLLDAHNAIVEKMGELGFMVTGQPRVWEITDPEARYFSDQGGIAPLFVNRGGKVGTTKAAVTPNPKQLLVGDIQSLPEARTLPDKVTGLSSQIKVPADTMSTWLKLALAAGVAAATYFAARPAFQNMTPNRRRRRGRLEYEHELPPPHAAPRPTRLDHARDGQLRPHRLRPHPPQERFLWGRVRRPGRSEGPGILQREHRRKPGQGEHGCHRSLLQGQGHRRHLVAQRNLLRQAPRGAAEAAGVRVREAQPASASRRRRPGRARPHLPRRWPARSGCSSGAGSPRRRQHDALHRRGRHRAGGHRSGRVPGEVVMAIIDMKSCGLTRYVDGKSYFVPACPDGTGIGVRKEYIGRSELTGECSYRTSYTCERKSVSGQSLGPDEEPCRLFFDGRTGCGVVALADARSIIAFAGVVAVGAGLYWSMRRR